MSDSTLSLSGVGSGIDWQSIISQFRAVENNRVTLLTNKQTAEQTKLSAWQSFATQLSALQSAAADLKTEDSFKLFATSLQSSSAVDPNSILTAAASSTAAKGSYQVVVNNLAQVEKLASGSFSSQTAALNLTPGTILLNGRAVNISASDTLQSIRTAINSVNTGENASGVTAAILQDSPGSYRLVLTSEQAGAAGISLQNGSASDTLASLGFNAAGTAIKNQVTGGAESDRFTSSTTAVEALLGIQAQNLSGNVTINGAAVTIDLSGTLENIRDTLNAAGLSAQIATETEGSSTFYRLQIEGMTSWTDDSNVLQALGLIEGNRGDVAGVTSSVANTSDGSAPITSATLITGIYGYLVNSPGDKITISGTHHDGTAVAASDFSITGATTVGDLLTQIQNQFGNVTATVTADGKIQVTDNATGTSQLSVSLATTLTGANAGSLDLGSFSNVGAVRKYVLQAGEDAAFTVDGMSMTSASNTVTSALAGVTLDLESEDPDTTVTVNVDQDVKGIEDKIQKMVDAYNGVLDFIAKQMKYDPSTKKTGGPLFGDSIMTTIKMGIQSSLLDKVGPGEIKHFTDMGFTIGSDNKLTFDSTILEGKLKTNFDDVVKFFADGGSCADNNFQYNYSTRNTKAGSYTIDITTAPAPGVDIAGTIDGRAAIGSGNTLRLSDPSSGADGLAVRYLGTAAASASFTYTPGLASLIETQMNSLTDIADGAVTVQENGIKFNIDAIGKKITFTQAQIDQKMATLQQQFIAMDTAVAQLQSLQSYMTTQLAALSSSSSG